MIHCLSKLRLGGYLHITAFIFLNNKLKKITPKTQETRGINIQYIHLKLKTTLKGFGNTKEIGTWHSGF